MGEFVWVLWLRKGGGNPWQGPLGREMDMSRAPSKSPTFTKSFHQTSSPRGHKLVHGNRLTHPPPLEECHKLKKSAPAKTAAPAPARKRTRRTTALEAEAKAEAERQAIEGRPRAPTKIWRPAKKRMPTYRQTREGVDQGRISRWRRGLRRSTPVRLVGRHPSLGRRGYSAKHARARTDDDYWGDADETALLAEWATDPLRPVIASANNNQVKHNWTL